MKTILVVGGAGYIGSYMCKYLSQNGFRPLVLDNFIYGHRQAVQWGSCYEGNLEDPALLDRIFSGYDIAAVMHFAAFAYVGESVVDPGKYYANNVAATVTLLESMRRHGVNNFIFSSTCATYGIPDHLPISEEAVQRPINPYGRSKLMIENILKDYHDAYGFASICLRYFNAAGADPEGEVGEDHRPETHLIPLILQVVLGQRDSIAIFGDDYPTRDGTCIRDYIHIVDLAQAHLLALKRLLGNHGGGSFNLGNGQGHSVKEVIAGVREVTGHPVPAVVRDRRPGDPAVLVGSSARACEILGWRPRYNDLVTILDTAWKWHKKNPDGYI